MLIITENMQILTWKDERGITQERLAYDLPRTDQRPFLQNWNTLVEIQSPHLLELLICSGKLGLGTLNTFTQNLLHLGDKLKEIHLTRHKYLCDMFTILKISPCL